MDSLLSEAAIRYLARPDAKRLVVALSGGVDSVSLCHAVSSLGLGKPIIGIHIDHGLQKVSGKFASHSAEVCEQLGVEFHVREVRVEAGGSLETNAREARYQAFDSFLGPGDLLLLAHHADDQVETVLFRLFRGSRVAGLEGMPEERQIGKARLLRPLLRVAKDDIIAYANYHNLTWIDDPMNVDMSPDRNYIRHKIMPVIESRWPEVSPNLLKSLEGDVRSRAALQAKYRQLLAETENDNGGLSLERMRGMDVDVLADLLTAWVLEANAPMPSGRLLNEVAAAVTNQHSVDVAARQLEIRQHNDSIYLLKPLPPPDVAGFSLQADEMDVPGGRITNKSVKGNGLKNSSYEVRYRQGGESLRIRRDRSLKNLCQENGIPPWLRTRLPLIFSGDEMVAVGGLPGWRTPMLISDGWAAVNGESGLEIHLHLEDRW